MIRKKWFTLESKLFVGMKTERSFGVTSLTFSKLTFLRHGLDGLQCAVTKKPATSIRTPFVEC